MSQRKPGDWDCANCAALCFARRTECHRCGRARPANVATPMRPGDWTCPQCGDHVFASRSECRKCGASNKRPGDWDCQCGEVNFGSREICRDCGAARPRDVDDDKKCKVCFERDKDAKLPCGHFGLCTVCAVPVAWFALAHL